MKALKPFRVYSRKEYSGEERRRKPRIYYPIPIKIRTRFRSGELFEFDTLAKDFSAGGFSAHAPIECQPGQKLFFIVRFSLAKNANPEGMKIAAHGNIVRSDKRSDGSFMFASTVTRYRVL